MASEFIALASYSKEVDWLKNLLIEISLWQKPKPYISIMIVRQHCLEHIVGYTIVSLVILT